MAPRYTRCPGHVRVLVSGLKSESCYRVKNSRTAAPAGAFGAVRPSERTGKGFLAPPSDWPNTRIYLLNIYQVLIVHPQNAQQAYVGIPIFGFSLN